MAKSSNPFATTEFKGGSYTSSYYKHDPWRGVNGTSDSTTTGVSALDLRASVNDLLGLKGKEEEYKAAAEGARYTSKGAALEAEAYGLAAGSAEQSAADEALLEQVREVQIATQVDQTLGDIKASVAGGNFQQSGSAIDILASSTRQGYLSQQISGYQSVQTQRGFLEQAAAAEGEQAAAVVRGEAADKLAAQYDTSATSAAANATALTGTLTKLLGGDDKATTLVNDLLAGNVENLSADVLAYNPPGEDEPLATSADTDTAAYWGRARVPT